MPRPTTHPHRRLDPASPPRARPRARRSSRRRLTVIDARTSTARSGRERIPCARIHHLVSSQALVIERAKIPAGAAGVAPSRQRPTSPPAREGTSNTHVDPRMGLVKRHPSPAAVPLPSPSRPGRPAPLPSPTVLAEFR
ncbi:uncharacterized protein [Triticum aestivum]|uniref:uncharacterized protein n=1 Tax=Triticum aestivum TaxID=4565 RepID=UPI001D032874|nr:uncharacterized protein LOC123172057 [Triticum aestivum]